MRHRAGTEIGAPVVELREVLLWGQLVLIDEAGGVWCSGCLRTFSVEELCRWDSPHRVRPPGTPRFAREGPVEFGLVSDEDRGQSAGPGSSW